MSLEEKLAKVKSPNLQSQQYTAVVLASIEETLLQQKAEFTPTAYFAALLALLKSQGSNQIDFHDDLLCSTVYLLDLVSSYVPPALLRTQFTTIAMLISPSLNSTGDNASLTRSGIGCLESVLIAQDTAAWTQSSKTIGPRDEIRELLLLASHSRPKISKRAQEALTNILKNPPPGPAVDHPAADLCATSAQHRLQSAVETAHQAKRQKNKVDDFHDTALIHALQLTRTIAIASEGWPSNKMEQLCELLLSISRSRNEYLVTSAFEVFEVVFESLKDASASAKLPRLLDAIVELKPAQNDSQLLPPWIAVLSRGYGVLAELEPEDVFARLPELFDLISSFLTSSSHNIRVSTSECLISFFANCIPDGVILEPSIYDEKVLQQIADRANGLLAVKFQSAWMEIFGVLSALMDALRWRGDPFLLPIVKAIGELRGNEGFQGKKEADEVLGHAIRNLGPRAVLTVLPHNLIKPRPGQPGRAWLLPILRDHVSNTNLQDFRNDLVPLSETMYQRVIDHGGAEKTMDIKVFETVVQQIWATLPGYCDLPLDLQTAMDQPFAEMISNILYKQTELRVDLCRGLQNLVESNQAILESDLEDGVLLLERRISRAEAEKNISHLAAFASNILAVLFNVYSQTLPQSRAFILQCINSYLGITPEKDLVDTFGRIGSMLESALPSPSQPPTKKEPHQSAKDKMPPTSHTLLDLVIALSVHLPRSTFGSLFAMANNILTNSSILASDPQLIKKAYKLIPRLATSATGVEALKSRSSELQQLMLSTADTTPVPARRDRLLAINTLIPFVPSSDLHFIPSILSEVVLACKDTNEKARTAGFETLITATEKVASASEGTPTPIRNRLVPHMPDDAPDATASLEEVFTMVSAGLAGVAPHMVAASITALSRLLFEYHNSSQLSEKMKAELVDTVVMFLQSNNREIVRAVLGFVKVMVVVLPLNMLEPRMGAVVPGLMVWSKENKGRLRVKVKGILERLMRRFGAANVESWVGEDDKKMVVNIRKRRERAKRKKSGNTEDDDEDLEETKTGKYDEAFDEAVYGSDDDDSEILGSDEDGDGDDAMSGVSSRTKQSNKRGRNSKKDQKQYIMTNEDDDEPLDLLDPLSLASISSSRRALPGKRQPGAKKSKATFNEDGKLIFDNDDAMVQPRRGTGRGRATQGTHNTNDEDEAAQGDAINAYLDAVDGPDAVRRGQKGRLRMKSGMQKTMRTTDQSRGGDEMDLDVDEAREVARKIMAGSTSPGRQRQKTNQNQNQNQRRGLGVDKQRAGSGVNANKKGGNGAFRRLDTATTTGGGRGGGARGDRGAKKGVRFSKHPRR